MNAPQDFGSVRFALRRATDQIHQALHHAAPFAAIADGSVTLAGYGATLAFLHRYHSAMQPLCARGALALNAPELAAAHANRIAALEDDLAHLNRAPADVAALPVADDDFCVGALYTVQGSTLGGKVIYRQLDGLLAGDAGRRFFKGTPDDGRNWQALCAGLETRTANFAQLEAGALHAFAMFEEFLKH